MRVHGAWIRIRIYYALCSKTYNIIAGLFWSATGSRRAARGTRIGETRLFFPCSHGLTGWLFWSKRRVCHHQTCQILSDIWLECTQQYCPKTLRIWILIFASKIFFNGFYNKIVEIGIFLRFLAIFSKVFNAGPWNLICKHIRNIFRCVINHGPWGHPYF